MSKIVKDARISARINEDVKIQAKIELSHRGLSLSDFIRIAVTAVANGQLPITYGLFNVIVNENIQEMVADLPNQTLQTANSASELENMLNN